jgi:hypothetical protein
MSQLCTSNADRAFCLSGGVSSGREEDALKDLRHRLATDNMFTSFCYIKAGQSAIARQVQHTSAARFHHWQVRVSRSETSPNGTSAEGAALAVAT